MLNILLSCVTLFSFHKYNFSGKGVTAAVMVRLDLGSVVLRRMRLDDIEAVKGLIKVLSIKSIPYTEEESFLMALKKILTY